MAFSNCPECAGEIPYQANVCPHCGHRFAIARRQRPIWVYLVFGVYALLVAFVLLIPFIVLAFGSENGAFLVLLVISAIMFLLGASLLVIPIGTYRERPVRRKLIIVPLLGSATSAALVFGGGAIATQEYLDMGETAFPFLLVATVLVWIGWCVLFGWLSRSVAPQTLNDRMYQLVLAGSVLELLIALPMHLVVRRRPECCAGLGTGLGIGVGIIVMVIAMGPAVFFLFFRRYKQAYGRDRGRVDC
jgi:predicted nucleic acid-binding Zn ribbon protein